MTAPAAAPARDPTDGLAALERLYAKKIVTLEEAQAAAKLLTGDPNTVFPAPKPAPEPAPVPAPAPAPEAGPAQGPAPGPGGDAADTSSNGSGSG